MGACCGTGKNPPTGTKPGKSNPPESKNSLNNNNNPIDASGKPAETLAHDQGSPNHNQKSDRHHYSEYGGNESKNENNYDSNKNPKALKASNSNDPGQKYMTNKSQDGEKSKPGTGVDAKSSGNVNYAYNNTALYIYDDPNAKYTIPPNSFEISHEDKFAEPEDYYLDMNEIQWKAMEASLAEQNKEKEKDKEKELPDLTGKGQSALMEWAKLLQKQFNQEKASISLTDNKNKLYKAYKTILGLKERNWYEEMTSLYKEKNTMSKATSSMTGLTFDRKLLQLQEQFRWFVSAVGNVKLNFNNSVGVHEFPPFRISSKSKKGLDKLESSNSSMLKGNSATDSDDEGGQSPNKAMMQSSLIPRKSQLASLSYKTMPLDPRQGATVDLPDPFSPVWQNGFVWKGVFLKLYSKKEAAQIKKEMKVLKHLAVECLQAETSIKISDAFPQGNSLNPNESTDNSKQAPSQFVNFILPLMCTVESSSWVLFGTPILPIKKSVAEDQSSKLVQDACGMFKHSFLLSSVTPKNFKVFSRSEEHLITSSISGNTAQFNSSYCQNHFLLLSNVSKVGIPLPRVDVMFTLNQESNAHVTFLDYPKRGVIDADLVKKVLGYAKLDISLAVFFKKDPKADNKPFYFDILRFKRRGWLFQMIYVVAKDGLPVNFTRNRRAMELLATSEKNKNKEIRGNVLIFGNLSNKETLVHPYFLSDNFVGHSFVESLDPSDNLQSNKNNIQNSKSLGKDGSMKPSSKPPKILKDDKMFQEYLFNNISKSLEYIIDYLENNDNVINFASLKELFHRKGVNIRLEWIVYFKLKRERVKTLVGADILVRCLKRMLNYKTSRKLSVFKKQTPMSYFEASAMKEKFDEMLQDKNEFLIEFFFKKHLCHFLNLLMKAYPETTGDEDAFFTELTTDLFLHRMRIFDFARKIYDGTNFDLFLSSEVISNLCNIGCLNANVLIDAVEYHMKVSINYEAVRQIRNDKYLYLVTSYGQPLKALDFNIIFSSDNYLSIRERCYLLLLKLLPSFPSNNATPIELIVPSALYKLRKDTQTHGLECYLRDYYEFPDLEILNDWVVLLESVLNGLYATDGEQTFLIQAFIIQLVLAFFGENDTDNQLSLSILERINALVNNSPVCSPELTITIHSWFGILSESKLFAECEQSYTMALLTLHKLYGDPRGRGAWGIPWELFITWRLSILSRLQGKIHDAEYSEELFDATAMTLRDNPLNAFKRSHYVYQEPFKDFFSGNNSKPTQQDFVFPAKPTFKTMILNDHPFPYWTHNLAYDENVSKIDTINSTLQKSPQLLKWILSHMPTLHNTGVLWDTAYLRDFVLAIMQSTFSNASSVSSMSGLSFERGKDKSSIGGLDGTSTPKSGMLKFDKKKDRFQGGNLVQIFEKDSSTLNKRELNGSVYSWGQNSEGQVGTPLSNVEEIDMPGKKMRIYYPKQILPLKDTIIVSVSCGHAHSMAITITRTLLAWGSNKSLQLGLGDKAPNQVFVPTPVLELTDVSQVSCGSEHTVAMTGNGLVYSWGQGEGGLLGHGDIQSQASPKVIQGLKNLEIQSIVCGGLHTLALTKQGACYSWGRGEGGQLGLPFDQLTHDPNTNELYLTVPKKIRGALDSVNVVQVACGDAHTLALAQNGTVYGWGYTNSGQLGLGVTGDTYDSNSPYSLQVKEPIVLERLSSVKITDIFAGSTFSLFLNDKKELYGCGLNDYNQIGLEKSVTKINNNLDNYRHVASNKTNECSLPKKIDCFTSMPILNVACGENHSLALVFYDSYYMLFAWGMQRHGQLGIGDIQAHFSTPRPISFLQYVRIYSMACGAYHSLVVLGDASKIFKKEALVERIEKKVDNKWSSISFEVKNSYEDMIDNALNNLDNIIPSEEGKIDNPKAMKKGN